MKSILRLQKGILLIFFLTLYLFSFSQAKIVVNNATINMKNAVYMSTADISLNSGASVVVDSSTIKVAGSISSSNNIDLQSGTLEMNGATAQTIPANSFTANKIQHLTISNDVSLAGEDSITGILSFGQVNSKTFSTGGYLTIKSTALRTANVADLTNNDVNSGNQVLGNVTAERYLSAVKKWRFLSVPTSTSQTIQAAWQENATSTGSNPVAGYGTQITGAGGTAAGFDLYSALPSMKTYNTATNNFTGVPNTNTALLNNITNNTVSYFLFVRGDRTANTYTSPVTATTLRTKGVIKQGDQAAIAIAAPATAFTAVGNPYPSQIDLRKMTPAPTTATKIYVWDPFATSGSSYGLGAYQTLTFDGSDFSATPGGGSYGAPYNKNPNYIESGEAFLVGGNASPYNINFKEDIKTSAIGVISTPNRLKQDIQADLFINNNGVASLMDGTKVDIGQEFSNKLDDDDAYKILNSSENISIRNSGKLLSVERYNSITSSDTFFLDMSNMKAQNYQWQINVDNLDQTGLNGFLEDNYQHTSTALSLNGSTTINFSVENVPASYAADRFSIVFSAPVVLNLTFTNVKAYLQNNNIAVEWKVENESNMKEYFVEKSVDGNNYVNTNTVAARNALQSNYAWLDEHATSGNNYYRIKSIDNTGKIAYSKTVKVFIGDDRKDITIFPNPVKNNIINLQLNNQPGGTYGIRLLNKLGQVLLSKEINHTAGTATENIELNSHYPHGIYQLEVTKPDRSVMNINVIY